MAARVEPNMPSNAFYTPYGTASRTARPFPRYSPASKGSNIATLLRWGLIVVLFAAMGATLTFLYESLRAEAPVKKTKAQRQLEKGIDGGQAKMDALADEQWKQAAAEAVKAKKDERGLLGKVPAAAEEETKVKAAAAMVSRRKRLIVLGDGNGRWNTGVWPGWGYDPNEIELNWAAAGVKVRKQCNAQCEWTRDASKIKEADAWIGELVNHPKFGIPASEPIAWPPEYERRDNPKAIAPGPKPTQIPSRLPLIGAFYYEAEQSYPQYTLASETIRKKLDFSVTPSKSRSTLPISMVCPWGRTTYDYVRPPPSKAPGRFIGYWNEHGILSSYNGYIDKMFQLAEKAGSASTSGANGNGQPKGIHAYIHKKNIETPPEAKGEPYHLENRLKYMGTYKFILVTEPIEEVDWVEPEFSQVFLSGAVPIYLGPPNAVLYSPGPRSFVNIRDFKSVEALMSYLEQFRGDDEETLARYRAEFFSWKDKAMSTFMMDEQGQNNPIGTGHGVVPPPKGFSPDVLAKQIQAFQPVPSGQGPDDKVQPLAEVRAKVDAAAGSNTAAKFEFVAEAQWRHFRRRLDQCVHYAECRICELVTLLTA